ncbi:MAG: class I SAM-dependent methyltransferase [Thermoplasmata archaeon]
MGADRSSILTYYSKGGSHARRYLFARSLTSGRDVLEVGCNNGAGAWILRGNCKSYTGIDVDVDAILWAQRNLEPDFPNARFLTTHEFERETSGTRFGVVLAFEVIEHTAEPVEFLRGLMGRLIPGGTMVISTPNGSLSRHARALFRIPEHVDEYSAEELGALTMRAGLVKPTFFWERRIDLMDIAWFKLRLRRFLRQHGGPERAGIGPSGRLSIGKVRGLLRDSGLDGPSFWTVRPQSAGDDGESLASDIIVVGACSNGS